MPVLLIEYLYCTSKMLGPVFYHGMTPSMTQNLLLKNRCAAVLLIAGAHTPGSKLAVRGVHAHGTACRDNISHAGVRPSAPADPDRAEYGCRIQVRMDLFGGPYCH